MAERQGFVLHKSRIRDPRAIGYGGWMLANAYTNVAELGGTPYAFCASLDDVEKYLTDS